MKSIRINVENRERKKENEARRKRRTGRSRSGMMRKEGINKALNTESKEIKSTYGYLVN